MKEHLIEKDNEIDGLKKEVKTYQVKLRNNLKVVSLNKTITNLKNQSVTNKKLDISVDAANDSFI